MNELGALAPSLGAGLLLGAFFFGGLWWTIIRGVSSRQPGLWFMGSMLVRTGITMAGFYLVGGAHWERWLSCLLGFLVARYMVKWLTRSSGKMLTRSAAETRHAP